MTESKHVWPLLKSGFERFKPRLHMFRVENSASAGIPDVYACHDGQSVWIELKVVKGGKLYFRTSQRVFAKTHSSARGSIFVLYRDDKTLNLIPIDEALASQESITGDGRYIVVDAGDLYPMWSGRIPCDWSEVHKSIFGV